jgi:hypothetical protein
MYYRVGTEERGPYTKQQLTAMWQRGHITADACCRVGDGEWVPMRGEFENQSPNTDPSSGASQRARPVRMTRLLKGAVLVLVLIGLGLAMHHNVIPMLTESRQPDRSAVVPPATPTINQQEVQVAWNRGHEAGFLLGIEQMRRYGHAIPVRGDAERAIKQTRLKDAVEQGTKWNENFEKAWQSAWVDGWMQGFQKGARKVFVDGQ